MFKFEKWLPIYFYLCVLACVLVTLLPWWPATGIILIVKYILLFSPRWLLLLGLLFLLFFWKHLTKAQRYLLPLLFLISIQYLNFGMHFYPKTNTEIGKKIKIITANIGEGGKTSKIKLLLKYYQPDILLLQDAQGFVLKNLSVDYKYSECLGELCIISKHSFEQTNKLSRSIVGGWGNSAVFYKLSIGGNIINLANVHLQSVHSLLIDIAKRSVDFSELKKVENNKRIETGILSAWIIGEPNSIIAGDFNMPIEENIYNDNFSTINNALSDAGFGFNYTLKTYGLRLRIDHVLFNEHFNVVDAQVIESLGGDHLPVMVNLIIKK